MTPLLALLGKTASDPRGFPIEPLSSVVLSFGASGPLEQITILADRPSPLAPYALRLEIPKIGQRMRERGLALLWARMVTVATAIVGSAQLRMVCEFEETFEFLQNVFRGNPKVVAHLGQYGPFSFTRASKSDIPNEMRALSFAVRASGPSFSPAVSEPPLDSSSAPRCVYIGVDYGRSDVKCAAVDAEGKVLSTFVTRWWRPSSSATDGRGYLDPATLETIESALRCLGVSCPQLRPNAAMSLAESSLIVCRRGCTRGDCTCCRAGRQRCRLVS